MLSFVKNIDFVMIDEHYFTGYSMLLNYLQRLKNVLVTLLAALRNIEIFFTF